ncbi:MAG: hypothetical protein IPM38_12085 [Ignavibacteria bacterium]|nr:hypothetical protein [Ignavibacteria bacterium]
MSLSKSIKALKGEAQKIMNEHRNKMDAVPDYSAFNDEQQTELRNKYLNKIKSETEKKFDEIIFHSNLNVSELRREINKIKYPFESQAVGSDARQQISMTKQRAENLALQKLDFNILNYLDNEINKNEIDFIFYFQNALSLNTSLSNELRAEINSKISEVENNLGVSNKNIELKMCDVLKNETEIFKQILEDDSPELKLQTGTYSAEMNELTNQLES